MSWGGGTEGYVTHSPYPAMTPFHSKSQAVSVVVKTLHDLAPVISLTLSIICVHVSVSTCVHVHIHTHSALATAGLLAVSGTGTSASGPLH